MVARNVGYNLGAQVWFLALSVAATPYLVHRFGVQVYGLYTLIATLTGYFAVLDLGLGVATVKFVSEHRGRGDDESVARVIGTALGAYLALGLLGAAAVALAASALVAHVLGVPAGLEGLARRAVLLAALGFVVVMPLSALNAIPTALQRMDVTNRRNVAFGTLNLAGTVALLAAGRGLLAVLVLAIGVNAVAAISFALTTRRLLPGVSLRPRLHLPTLRLLLGFGSFKFANQVATQTVYHVDKLLVAALASVSAVTWYAVPVALAQRLAGLVGNVAAAFLPAASELHGQADEARFAELYVRSTKLVALLVFPVGSFLIVFAEPLLRIWLGEPFARHSTDVLRVLAAGYVVNALSTMPAVACDSRGRPRVTTAFSLASTALNVSLSVVLIPRFGVLGASFAILVNSLALVPVFLVYVHRRVLRIPVGGLVRRSLLRPAAATAVLAVPASLLAGSASSAGALLLAFGGGIVLYLGLTVALGTYDAADRALVRSLRHRAVPAS